jgi:hypothetical protein
MLGKKASEIDKEHLSISRSINLFGQDKAMVFREFSYGR